MDIIGLYHRIQKGDLPPLCWIVGEEEYSADATIQAARRLVEFEELNITEYKGPFDVEDFVSKLGIAPMMAAFRLILIQKTRLLHWCKDERFYDALERLPDFVRVVIYEPEYLKTQVGYKRLSKSAECVVADRFTRPQMNDWLKRQAKQRGLDVAPDVLRAVLERSGYFVDDSETTMYDLVHAFEYFESLKRTIRVEDVDAYFGSTLHASVFELYDTIGTPAFYRYVRTMIAEGEAPLKLLAMIGNFVRNIYKFKCFQEFGQSSLIASEMTPFIQKKAAAKAKLFRTEELASVIERCVEVDGALKSTSVRGDAMLESLSLELSQQSGAL